LILFIPFPRVRGKVGWGRPDQGVLILSILFCFSRRFCGSDIDLDFLGVLGGSY